MVSHSRAENTTKQGWSDTWAWPSEQEGILFFVKFFGQRCLEHNYLLPTITFKIEQQVFFILKGEKQFLWKSSRGETPPAMLIVPTHIPGFGGLKEIHACVLPHNFINSQTSGNQIVITGKVKNTNVCSTISRGNVWILFRKPDIIALAIPNRSWMSDYLA